MRFRLRQETKFPDQQSTSLVVTAPKALEMALRLRIPAWLKSAPTVKVNGRALEASASPGSYLALRRTWKTGDRGEMELPMHLSVEPMPDDPKVQAFLGANALFRAEPFDVTEFSLIASYLTKSGAIYEDQAAYRLT